MREGPLILAPGSEQSSVASESIFIFTKLSPTSQTAAPPPTDRKTLIGSIFRLLLTPRAIVPVNKRVHICALAKQLVSCFATVQHFNKCDYQQWTTSNQLIEASNYVTRGSASN